MIWHDNVLIQSSQVINSVTELIKIYHKEEVVQVTSLINNEIIIKEEKD